MQYIRYCKINQNRHLFVKLPTQVKYKRFGKKNVYIKQKATGRGNIFAPNPFFLIGISIVALLFGAGQPDLEIFIPPSLLHKNLLEQSSFYRAS